MKKLLLIVSCFFITYLSNGQYENLSYAEGAQAAVESVNSLKATLLNSGPYMNWGYTTGFTVREITAGDVTVYVSSYSYFWSNEQFNIATWNDVSVEAVKNWAYPNRYTSEYFRGFSDTFDGYWFFDDFYFQ